MGVRGRCQVRQPEYGDCCLTSWAQDCAYDWLTNVAKLEIYTRDQEGGFADTWEIELPDDNRMHEIISHLRRRPKCLGEDGDDGDEEFVRDQLIPAIPKEDEMVVSKIITDWMMNEAKFKGTKTQKRKIATDIAKNMVWDGTCFTDVGYMETNDYGLLNISGERVFEEWDYQTGKEVA